MKRRAFLATAVGVVAGCATKSGEGGQTSGKIGSSTPTVQQSRTATKVNESELANVTGNNSEAAFPPGKTTRYSSVLCEKQQKPSDGTVTVPATTTPRTKTGQVNIGPPDPLYIINNDSESHTILLVERSRNYVAHITVCAHSREKTKYQIWWNSDTNIVMGNQVLKHVSSHGRYSNDAYIIITSNGELTLKVVPSGETSRPKPSSTHSQ